MEHYPEYDQRGKYGYPEVWNWDAGVWERYDGHAGHSRMVTKFASVTSAGSSFGTLASTQKAYITFLSMQPRNTGVTACTVHVVASGATAATMLVVRLAPQPNTAAGKGSTNNFNRVNRPYFQQGDGVTPFIVIAAGKTIVVKSRANGIPTAVTMTYYKESTTGNN